MKGQIYKAHSSNFFVKCDDEIYKVGARGILKIKSDGLKVGDYVEFSDGVIEKVLPRENSFIRPSVSNIDNLVVVISPEPKPDYLLIDKLIINALNQNLEIIFVINKTDIDDTLYDNVVEEYDKCGIKFLRVSAKERTGIDELKLMLSGKLCLLVGQSAVGKTSLVNAMFDLNLKTGELSEKILRGKHTTTYSEIHEYGGVRLVDSPGFAVLDAEITLSELPYLYPEFEEYYNKCRFRTCTHVSEPDCSIKQAVENGKINKNRYLRYLEIYKELQQRRTVYEKN